jgi:hypothetical protein
VLGHVRDWLMRPAAAAFVLSSALGLITSIHLDAAARGAIARRREHGVPPNPKLAVPVTKPAIDAAWPSTAWSRNAATSPPIPFPAGV